MNAGSKTKGLILAAGKGSRLYPATSVVCKQLLLIYDKPLIYYPLATLMQAGITDIMIIPTPRDLPQFERLLGDGSQLGLSIVYKPQENSEGIAQAFIIAEEFIGDDNVMLILGDNIFHGDAGISSAVAEFYGGALVFGYQVNDPERFGILEFDGSGKVVDIEEKPSKPKSNYAVTGLYLYDSGVIEIARGLSPSDRGELEITDVNKAYLGQGQLKAVLMDSDLFWIDAGTADSMLEAGSSVATLQNESGRKIACLEEIALRNRFIDESALRQLIAKMGSNDYRAYLEGIIGEADDSF